MNRDLLLQRFVALLLAGVLVLQAGCATIAEIGAASGVITAGQAQALVRTGDAFGKALEQITPEQEYYVGRAVGASIVHEYGEYGNEALTRYLNRVGQSLAMASDKPETFGGYHFMVLESEDINAFAAPGGLIFLSRGMLRLCRNEDELAAVLAHEIAHVNLGHAISAISNSRWTSAFAILGTESMKNLGGQELAQLTTAFEGSIQDITKTLVTSGYARGQEREADALAVKFMRRVGYEPAALASMLESMAKTLRPGGLDFAKTHPPPAARIQDLRPLIAGSSVDTAGVRSREARFERAMRGI